MKKPCNLCLYAITFILFYSCTLNEKKGENLIVDIPEIINKTPEEVVAILGEPDTAFVQMVVTLRFHTQLYYDLDSLEIQYLDGTSKDIVVHKPLPLPLNKMTLEAFGLESKEPTDKVLDEVLRWENYEGFKMVNMYAIHKDKHSKIDDYKIFFKAK